MPTAEEAAIRAYKVLRKLKSKVEVTATDGWGVELDKRRLTFENMDPTTALLEFKTVVDHHQAEGNGLILRRSYTLQPVSAYIKRFHNPPESWSKGGKIEVTTARNRTILCDLEELLILDDRTYPIASTSEKFNTIKKRMESDLNYKGGG